MKNVWEADILEMAESDLFYEKYKADYDGLM